MLYLSSLVVNIPMDYEFDRNFNANDFVYIYPNQTVVYIISSVNVDGTYTIVGTASASDGSYYQQNVPASCADSFLVTISAQE